MCFEEKRMIRREVLWNHSRTLSINVSTELEMTSNDRQNGGKAHNVTLCKCALPVILNDSVF